MDVIVGIVDEIRLEAGGREVLYISRHEGQIDRQSVAPRPFFHRSHKVDGGVVVRLRIGICLTPVLFRPFFIRVCGGKTLPDAASVLTFFYPALLLVDTQSGTVGCDVFHHDNLTGRCRYLESVFVFDQYEPAFETCDDATAGITQKSDFVSYFHVFTVV